TSNSSSNLSCAGTRMSIADQLGFREVARCVLSLSPALRTLLDLDVSEPRGSRPVNPTSGQPEPAWVGADAGRLGRSEVAEILYVTARKSADALRCGESRGCCMTQRPRCQA